MQQNPERTKDSAAVTAFKGLGLGLELTMVPIGEMARGGSSRLQDYMLGKCSNELWEPSSTYKVVITGAHV